VVVPYPVLQMSLPLIGMILPLKLSRQWQQKPSSSLPISKASPHCSQSKCGAAGNRRQPPLTSLLSLAATGSLTATSSGRRSAGVSSALLVAALIDRLHVRNLHEMFPP